MTNKEAIIHMEEIRPKKCKMVDGRLKGGFPDHDSDTGKAIDVAIEALEKADKYRWHNLRENPDDLPVLKFGYEYVEVITDGDNYLPFPIQYDDAIMKFGEWRSIFDPYSLGYVDSEFEEWNTERFEEIIAWRYIEEFEAGKTE